METPARSFAPFWRIVLFVLIWTGLILCSLLLQREQLNRTAVELARIAAIANLKKDMAIRDWAAQVDGVFIREQYVPDLDALEQEQRFMTTDRQGKRLELVLVTPMHLLLAVQGMSNKESGFHERLTALQLRNRANRPDDWEQKALAQLEKGAQVVTETLPQQNGHGLMRVMIPMRMENDCLECHRDTLIPVGGLRGGASIAVDLNAYRSAQEPAWRSIQAWHGGVWLCGLVILVWLHVSLLRRDRERRRHNQQHWQDEQSLRESQARLRELTGFLQDVRERERTSIARELHDELGQALTALRFDLGWLRKHCGNEALGERIGAAHAQTERTIEAVRRISEGLRPGMLDVLGLCAALEHLAQQFEAHTDVACVFHADRDDYELDTRQSIAVFRLVQEALTNVSRHAKASQVDIRLCATPEKLHLSIVDDGVGFDVATPKSGFGLLGMSERVSLLGGDMKIDGRHGVRIDIVLPLHTTGDFPP